MPSSSRTTYPAGSPMFTMTPLTSYPALWRASVIVTRSPATSTDPPLFIGTVLATPFDPSHTHNSKMPTTGAPLSRATAMASSMWSACPCETRMRSTLGGFFIALGHDGFPFSHGSKMSRLPPAVFSTNVECPSQVMLSFDIYGFTNLRIDELRMQDLIHLHPPRSAGNAYTRLAEHDIPSHFARHNLCTSIHHESASGGTETPNLRVRSARCPFLQDDSIDLGGTRVLRSIVSIGDAGGCELSIRMPCAFTSRFRCEARVRRGGNGRNAVLARNDRGG